MLSVSDLIDINYIPDEDDISLQLLIDFYEEYLCKRIFIFTLKNGKIIKLFFRDATEIFHVSGINHIYEGVPMDGKRFLQGVKNKTIDLKTVEKVNAAAYKDFVIRIRSMACIDAIIKKCEYLWFPDAKIPDSKMEVRYLLLKGLDKKNLHLGITRLTRDEWKVSLKNVIAEKRADIRCEIEKYDGYTSGEILGEVIRKYEKEELNLRLSQKIIEFISQKGKDIVCDILKEEIIQQKEVVLRGIDKILKEE